MLTKLLAVGVLGYVGYGIVRSLAQRHAERRERRNRELDRIRRAWPFGERCARIPIEAIAFSPN